MGMMVITGCFQEARDDAPPLLPHCLTSRRDADASRIEGKISEYHVGDDEGNQGAERTSVMEITKESEARRADRPVLIRKK